MSGKRRAQYPRGGMAILAPDPRRKSRNLVCYGQQSRYAPLEVYCANGCAEKGKARPDDDGCRHSDLFIASLKPYWQKRARPVTDQQPARHPAEGEATT